MTSQLSLNNSFPFSVLLPSPTISRAAGVGGLPAIVRLPGSMAKHGATAIGDFFISSTRQIHELPRDSLEIGKETTRALRV